MHAIRFRAVAALLAALGLTALLGAAPGHADPPTPPLHAIQPPTTQLTPSVIIPDTSKCPNRITPPPPVDLSEVPDPSAPVPTPVPLPDRPVGGPRMGECGLVLPEGAPTPPDGINATSWLLADAGSGEVLAAKNPHARNRPASTIKLLTALLAADRLPADQVVIATQADADQEGSSAGIGPAGTYTVRQLLSGLLLVSGNDTAHALAQQLGGVPATIEQMNALAAELGALDTRTATPSGLDGPGMSTSSYDLALVFRQVLSRPLLAELLSTRQVDFPGFGERPGFMLSNDNKLLTHYPGAVGGKTGFTDDARHTYIGAAVRDGRPLIVVLMRGEQRPVPMWEQASRLLDYGFTLPPGHPVGLLVTEAPQPERPTTPAATPAVPATADSGAASQSASRDEPSALVTALPWIGLAVIALAVLGALLRRHRRRTGS